MRIEKSFDIPIYNADRRGTALPFGTSFFRTFGGHGASRTQKQKRQKICNRYFFHGLSPYDFRFINGNLIAPSAIIARQYNRQQLLFLRGFSCAFTRRRGLSAAPRKHIILQAASSKSYTREDGFRLFRSGDCGSLR